jgi:hypothetical protein
VDRDEQHCGRIERFSLGQYRGQIDLEDSLMAKKVSKAMPPMPPLIPAPSGGPLAPNDLAAIEGMAAAGGAVTGNGGNGNGNGDGGHPAMPGFDVYGISGLTRFGAVSRVYEEYLRELQGPQGMKNYREMMDNCPIVGAILFAANHLCRKVSFKFKPANASNEARFVADFMGGAIFDDLESAWPDTLSEVLTMLPFGWSLLEFRLKRRVGMGEFAMRPPELGTATPGGIGYPVSDFSPSRFEDGLIGFRSWALRSQETLFMWEFDEDSNAVVMQQMAPPDYKVRRVPLDKAFLFRTQVSKNNPEGRSILRNAWTSYYMKKNLQVFEGIGIERDLAGYPLIQMMQPDLQKGLAVPDIWNPNDPQMVALLSQLKKIVRSVRRDEQEGIVMPWWAEFKLVSTSSRRSFDTNSIIGRYDQRIAMSVMADFIMLGHEAVGSKALAATKISLFTSALSSFLDTIKAIVDRRASPMLLRFNGVPQELAPSLDHGDVESINIQELGEFISKIAGTGFNPLAGVEAQKAVMEAARLPTTDIVDPTDANVSGELGDSTSDTMGDGPPVAPAGSQTGPPSVLTAKGSRSVRGQMAKAVRAILDAAFLAGSLVPNSRGRHTVDMGGK